MNREPISCRAVNAITARWESFAARKARVFKRAVFNLAAYIDNNGDYRVRKTLEWHTAITMLSQCLGNILFYKNSFLLVFKFLLVVATLFMHFLFCIFRTSYSLYSLFALFLSSVKGGSLAEKSTYFNNVLTRDRSRNVYNMQCSCCTVND